MNNKELITEVMQEYPGALNWVMACHSPEHQKDMAFLDMRKATLEEIQQWSDDHWHDQPIFEIDETEIQAVRTECALKHAFTPPPTDEQVEQFMSLNRDSLEFLINSAPVDTIHLTTQEETA